MCIRDRHIALVFIVVNGLFQEIPPRIFVKIDLRVMPRDNIIIIQLNHALKQLIKLQIAVAIDARIRRHTRFIRVHKLVDNIRFEAVGKIKHIVRHVKRCLLYTSQF